jgi:hypothetical protein
MQKILFILRFANGAAREGFILQVNCYTDIAEQQYFVQKMEREFTACE